MKKYEIWTENKREENRMTEEKKQMENGRRIGREI